MGVKYDFSDVNAFFEQGFAELDRKTASVGEEAVDYARKNGNYRNRTGNLRRSSTSRVKEHSLILENTADYASNVEARGYDVLTGAALFASRELNGT